MAYQGNLLFSGYVRLFRGREGASKDRIGGKHIMFLSYCTLTITGEGEVDIDKDLLGFSNGHSFSSSSYSNLIKRT